jgi:CRP-like cAMP-binding protein
MRQIVNFGLRNLTDEFDDGVFASIALFRDLAPGEIAALRDHVSVQSVPDATLMTRQGQDGEGVFLVLSGKCLGLMQSENGKQMVLDRIGPGRIFGELSFLDGGPRVRTVRTDGPVRLGLIPAACFHDWLLAHPVAMRNLLSEVVANTRAMADRFYEMAVYDVEARVRLFLFRLLGEIDALRDGGTLDPAPSHSLIAAHVGANREAVSRAVSRFNKSGLLESGRRKIVVNDIGALRQGLH